VDRVKKTSPARIPGLLAVLLSLPAFSCAGKIPVSFPVQEGGLYGLGGKAAAGVLDLSKPGTWRYVFEQPVRVSFAALEIGYAFSAPPGDELTEQYQIVLQTGAAGSWVLPWDGAFLSAEGAIRAYAVPLSVSALEGFSLSLVRREGRPKKGPFSRIPGAPRLELQSLGFKKPWYGFIREGGGILATPFVYAEPGGFSIAPPARWRLPGAELRVVRRGAALGPLRVETGSRRIEAPPWMESLRVPAALLDDSGPVTLRGEDAAAFYLASRGAPPFPEPVPADPGIILEYPREAWRDPRYEIFRWERFPSVLIMDAADYATQDRLFKRLCFFVEKKGFRGRIAGAREIEDLHGWNAHDYRAEDLARFFDAAADLPLFPEERELEQILLDEGLIRREGGRVRPGEGALVSVSRESAAYLRALFMAHEGFHGLFFIDEDFRAFSRRRWAGLSPAARTFILSYFDYQGYDTGDEYLVVNEFMAHCLQQPVSQVPRYFGETLASRLDASPRRRSALPEKDEASNSWPELGRAFRAEAEAFSEYVNRRWNLSAGRVWDVQVRESREPLSAAAGPVIDPADFGLRSAAGPARPNPGERIFGKFAA
jgi:hypothetical protein